MRKRLANQSLPGEIGIEEYALVSVKCQRSVMPQQTVTPDSVQVEIVHVRPQRCHSCTPDSVQVRIAGLEASMFLRRPETRVELNVSQYGFRGGREPNEAQRALRE